MCAVLWTDLLTANGVDLRVIDTDRVTLGDAPAAHLVVLDRPLRGRDITALSDRATSGLVIAASIGPQARRRLTSVGWSWIDERAAEGHLASLRLDLDDHDLPAAPLSRQAQPAWPRGFAAFTIVRHLLAADSPSLQTDLASLARCSQPLVSRTLRRLAVDGLVMQTGSGWVPSDTEMLARWWIQRYRGPGGIILRFHSDLDPWDAAGQIHDAALDTPVLFSGAIAADAMAPWTEPATVTCYAAGHLELDTTDLIESANPDAAVRVIVPADTSIWDTATTATVAMRPTPVPVTDLLQTAWHIDIAHGRSAEEQLRHLLKVLPRQHADL